MNFFSLRSFVISALILAHVLGGAQYFVATFERQGKVTPSVHNVHRHATQACSSTWTRTQPNIFVLADQPQGKIPYEILVLRNCLSDEAQVVWNLYQIKRASTDNFFFIIHQDPTITPESLYSQLVDYMHFKGFGLHRTIVLAETFTGYLYTRD